MQVHTIPLTIPVVNDRGQDVVEKVVPQGGRLGTALFPTTPQRDRVSLRAFKINTEGDNDQLPENGSSKANGSTSLRNGLIQDRVLDMIKSFGDISTAYIYKGNDHSSHLCNNMRRSSVTSAHRRPGSKP